MGADRKDCRLLVNHVCIGAIRVEGYYRLASRLVACNCILWIKLGFREYFTRNGIYISWKALCFTTIAKRLVLTLTRSNSSIHKPESWNHNVCLHRRLGCPGYSYHSPWWPSPVPAGWSASRTLVQHTPRRWWHAGEQPLHWHLNSRVAIPLNK